MGGLETGKHSQGSGTVPGALATGNVPDVQAETIAHLSRVIDLAARFITENNALYSPSNFLSEARFAGPAKHSVKLADLAIENGLRVRLEQPSRWLQAGLPGADYCAQLYGNLFVILSALRIPFGADPIARGMERDKLFFGSRVAAENEILFAYHCADRLASEGPIARNVWSIKESVFPPFFSFDRTGFAGWSEIANSRKLFQKSAAIEYPDALMYAAHLRRWVTEQRVTKYAQPGPAGIPVLDRPYVFHPLQISKDSVVSLSRIPHQELIQLLVEGAANFDTPLVIKRHPRCKDATTAAYLHSIRNSPNVFICDGAVHDLIAGAQSVVVINSGVGFEALIQNKPVYTAGRSEYHWATHQISDKQDLYAAFKKPEVALDPIQHAQFLALYFREYCVNATSPKSVEDHVVKALVEWLTLKGLLNCAPERCN